jgi:hypothetical protein
MKADCKPCWLWMLEPGQKFRICDQQLALSGTVVSKTEGGVTVRLDGNAHVVRFISVSGEERSFVASGGKQTVWSRNTLVTPAEREAE